MNIAVFDLHGTLLDKNEIALIESTNYSLERHKRKERIDMEFCKRYQGQPWANYFSAKCPDVSQKKIESMVRTAKRVGIEMYPRYVRPMEHAIEVLGEVKRRCDEVLVVSSTTLDAFDGFLDSIGIKDFVDHKVGITKEQERSGNPDVIEHKASEIGKILKKKYYEKKGLTGDSESDIKVGKKSGLETFFFNKEGAKLEGADHSITDLREMLPFFYEDYKLGA